MPGGASELLEGQPQLDKLSRVDEDGVGYQQRCDLSLGVVEAKPEDPCGGDEVTEDHRDPQEESPDALGPEPAHALPQPGAKEGHVVELVRNALQVDAGRVVRQTRGRQRSEGATTQRREPACQSTERGHQSHGEH